MFKEKIIDEVKQILPIDDQVIESMIAKSEKKEFGDYTLPCFKLAKYLHKSPNIIAKEIVKRIKVSDWIIKCENIGGYVNFYINKILLCDKILGDIFDKKEHYGSSGEGKGKSCLIEHTSINPNASPHIGRARNAIVGDFISRLMRFEGYKVDVHYFVNDIGKQISMLVLAAEERENIEFEDLLNLYISINQKVAEDKNLERKVFDLLYKLENGNEDVKRKFKKIVDICIEGQTKLLKELGIYYDCFDYESKFLFDNSLKRIISILNEKQMIFEDEDKRYVVNLEKYGLPPLVVTRNDKTSLYSLRDIAYTIWKSKKGADKNIIVLGQDQQLYFKQIAAIVSELGYVPPMPVHYAFVLLVESKMSTRQGTVVLLEDFMKEAINKAKKEILSRGGECDIERTKKIAYSAVKYSIEKTSNDRNVIFDWEKALSFEGNTGPYILYSFARINSILKKCDNVSLYKWDAGSINDEYEIDLLKYLGEFPDIIQKAKKEMSPHIITNYLFELSKRFSVFYVNCSVLKCKKQVHVNRVYLILAVEQVLKNALSIIGIQPVEYM